MQEPETTGASACSMSSESKQHHSEYDHVGDGDLSKHRTGRTKLECGLPLSKSVLYTLQRAFYQSHSVDAWTKSIVPNYITTNQYIADQYALGFCGMQCHAVREVALGATLVPRFYHRACADMQVSSSRIGTTSSRREAWLWGAWTRKRRCI